MMAKNKRFAEKSFTALGGNANLFAVTKDATPELYGLWRQFPEALAGALKSLGRHVRKNMQETVRQGGPAHERWLELSNMRRYRRMERLKKGQIVRGGAGGKAKGNMMQKWVGSPEDTVFGKVARALAWRKPGGKNAVEIGALSPSAASFLSAVQEGRRGGKGAFQFAGRQAVTPRMRRALWAAGVPIGKHTAFIGQEARPLVPPVFKKVHPEIEIYLVRKMTAALARRGISWVSA